MEVQRAKHGLTRPEEGYERVLWGDLKAMFEPDIESDSLEAIFFKWSTFCEISKFAYLYAGREKVSTYTCNNHRNAQQEASS
ncbi:hypothetical protein Tco_0330702 [Tanacetum coccineum]